jgi:hypothetical protein
MRPAACDRSIIFRVILTHSALNAVHFLAFIYPALAS